MTAIHLPSFRSYRNFTPAVEPHWVDATRTVDLAFAERSARYLGSVGYRPEEVHRVLVDELQVTHDDARTIVEAIIPAAAVSIA